MNDNLFFLDTNILVYAFDNSEKRKQKIAAEILDKCFTGQKIYALSSQNLAEFFLVITDKIERPLTVEDAKNVIIKINNFKGIRKLSYNSDTVIKSILISERNNIKIWDSLLIATMLDNDIFNIYTENEKDFNRIKNINVVNPFQ